MTQWCSKHAGRLAIALVVLLGLSTPAFADTSGNGAARKLDTTLSDRATKPGKSRVIVMLKPGSDISLAVRLLGGTPGRMLPIINGQVIELPNAALRTLASHAAVVSLHDDRRTAGHMNRVAVAVGARAVQQDMGFDGAGIGVAVIDSGITSWHDDLTYTGTSLAVRTVKGQRVAAFVDFVQGRTSTYDDHGHGTHVSGIIAGNGYDSRGSRAGIAPAAHLVGLKVLDSHGRGRISDVIAALGWVVQNRATYNLRVANLSVGAAVLESYNTDPLTLAARRTVDAGVVVVTAAGNLGKNALGHAQYGGITAPGNAPWVLTVGASSTEGTVSRVDDVIASYSSRGPSAIDFEAKPDIVAPGTGVVSLSDPTSTLYTAKAEYLLKGSLLTSYKPYLSLSGTSMAAPVVSGTVALMLQANPTLTPNLVKAILQFTAQQYGYNSLTEGAGFLNAKGATQLAHFFATAQPGAKLNMPRSWSKHVIWGNHEVSGGVIRPNVNAWQPDTVWGALRDGDGENIVWGSLCNDACENIVWGSFDLLNEENIVWGSVLDVNGQNIVWGAFRDGENIVWGSLLEGRNIVWGSECAGADCENIVWGSSTEENIVWGSVDESASILWGSGSTQGTVWGTSDEDGVVAGEAPPLYDDPNAEPPNFDATPFELLFEQGEPAIEPQGTTALHSVTPVTITGGLI